jgi:hypothetical protein
VLRGKEIKDIHEYEKVALRHSYITAFVFDPLRHRQFCTVGLRFHAVSYQQEPNFRHSKDIFVYPQTTARQILESIPDSIVINKKSLERVFDKYLEDEELKPGHFVIEKGKPSIYVAQDAESRLADAGGSGSFWYHEAERKDSEENI